VQNDIQKKPTKETFAHVSQKRPYTLHKRPTQENFKKMKVNICMYMYVYIHIHMCVYVHITRDLHKETLKKRNNKNVCMYI